MRKKQYGQMAAAMLLSIGVLTGAGKPAGSITASAEDPGRAAGIQTDQTMTDMPQLLYAASGESGDVQIRFPDPRAYFEWLSRYGSPDPADIPAADPNQNTESDGAEEISDTTDGAQAGLTYRSDIRLRLAPAMFDRLTHRLPMPEKTMAVLEQVLERQVTGYDGTWSVHVTDLATLSELQIGETAMKSASTMKLFVLGAVYDALEQGTLERTDELVELMSSMIRASSNTATNELIRRLGDGDFPAGVDAVNAYIQANGYHEETHLYNGFQDESLILNPGHENTVCPEDAASFLEKVYHRKLAGRTVCNEIETWMLEQETRYKIPKGLPENVSVGNKTGETDSVENDCAVIYSGAGDYILCVFSHSWDSKEQAQERITALSASVYDFYLEPGVAMAKAMHLPADYFAVQ